MKMGEAPSFLFLISLLLSVASARDAFMSVDNDVARNHLFMEDSMDVLLHDLAKIYKDHQISSSEASPSDFSEACLDVSRKAKEGINDQSIVNEIDSLANTLCYMMPSDLEAKLKANGTCSVCRSILDTVSSALGDTDKQLVIILYLIKICKIQGFADKCKKMVFTFGPIILTAVQTVASKDICYTLKICSEAKNVTQYANLFGSSNFEPYLQSELGNLDLM